MAHTYNTKTNSTRSNGNPKTFTHTCGTGSTLLVLTLVIDGATARTGGAPTYNGVTMTQADSSRSATETTVEMWYMLDPPTGSAYTISIPNSGTLYITAEASSYIAAAGSKTKLSSASYATATSTNPTGPTHSDTRYGDVIIAVMGFGDDSSNATASGTDLHATDEGTYVSADQYSLDGRSSLMWTDTTSEDWVIVSAVFTEYADVAASTENVSKAVGYAVLSVPEAMIVSKAVAYAVLGPPEARGEDGTHSVTSDNITLIVPALLSVDDSTHSSTADNVVLPVATVLLVNDTIHSVYNPDQLLQTESGDFVTDEAGNYIEVNDGPVLVLGGALLTVADSMHAVSSDNADLTQVHSLSVDDSSHAVTSDNVSLGSAVDLIVEYSSHAVSSDNVVLTQNHNLSVDDSTHSVTSDNVDGLDEYVSLTVNDSTHSVSSDNVSLSQSHSLVPADSSHSVTSDNVSISVLSTLSVDDSTHSVTSDNITAMDEYVSLAVTDSSHSVTSDNVDLTQTHTLTVSDSNHSVSSDNTVLVLNITLTVNDSNHSISSDNVSLSQVHSLVVDDSIHSHTVDSAVLYQVHILYPEESNHDVSSDNVILTQLHNLNIDDSVHSVTSDNVTVKLWTVVNADDSTIAVSSDNVDLFQSHTLSVQSSDTSVDSDNVVLVQVHILSNVSDCFHGQSADSILSMLEAEIAFKPFFSQANHFIW